MNDSVILKNDLPQNEIDKIVELIIDKFEPKSLKTIFYNATTIKLYDNTKTTNILEQPYLEFKIIPSGTTLFKGLNPMKFKKEPDMFSYIRSDEPIKNEYDIQIGPTWYSDLEYSFMYVESFIKDYISKERVGNSKPLNAREESPKQEFILDNSNILVFKFHSDRLLLNLNSIETITNLSVIWNNYCDLIYSKDNTTKLYGLDFAPGLFKNNDLEFNIRNLFLIMLNILFGAGITFYEQYEYLRRFSRFCESGRPEYNQICTEFNFSRNEVEKYDLLNRFEKVYTNSSYRHKIDKKKFRRLSILNWDKFFVSCLCYLFKTDLYLNIGNFAHYKKASASSSSSSLSSSFSPNKNDEMDVDLPVKKSETILICDGFITLNLDLIEEGSNLSSELVLCFAPNSIDYIGQIHFDYTFSDYDFEFINFKLNYITNIKIINYSNENTNENAKDKKKAIQTLLANLNIKENLMIDKKKLYNAFRDRNKENNQLIHDIGIIILGGILYKMNKLTDLIKVLNIINNHYYKEFYENYEKMQQFDLNKIYDASNDFNLYLNNLKFKLIEINTKTAQIRLIIYNIKLLPNNIQINANINIFLDNINKTETLLFQRLGKNLHLKTPSKELYNDSYISEILSEILRIISELQEQSDILTQYQDIFNEFTKEFEILKSHALLEGQYNNNGDNNNNNNNKFEAGVVIRGTNDEVQIRKQIENVYDDIDKLLNNKFKYLDKKLSELKTAENKKILVTNQGEDKFNQYEKKIDKFNTNLYNYKTSAILLFHEDINPTTKLEKLIKKYDDYYDIYERVKKKYQKLKLLIDSPNKITSDKRKRKREDEIVGSNKKIKPTNSKFKCKICNKNSNKMDANFKITLCNEKCQEIYYICKKIQQF
jgi:hypothetical protein